MNTKELVQKVEPKFLEVIEATGVQLEWIKESGFAMQAIDGSEMLQKCSTASIMKSIYNIALTGLTLNPKLAYCYLVPRGGHAILDISYQGLIYMMTNQLNIKHIHADEIFEKDEFDYYTDHEGTKIHHRPNKFGDRGASIGSYAVAYFNNNDCVAVVLNNEEINKIKGSSKSAGSQYSPWTTFEGEMRKKTAVRRLWKLVPKTDRLDEAIVNGLGIDNENYEPKWKEAPKKEKKDFSGIFEAEAEEVQTEEAEIVEEKVTK